MIPRNQPSPYPPVTLDTSKASLVSAASESAAGVKSGTVAIAERRLGVRRLHARRRSRESPMPPGSASGTVSIRRCCTSCATPRRIRWCWGSGWRPLATSTRSSATRSRTMPARQIRWRAGFAGGFPKAARSRARSCELLIQLGFNQDEQGRRRLGRQQPAHRVARHRSESAFRHARRHGVAVRAGDGSAACGGKTGMTRRGDAARPACSIAAARRTPARRSWRHSAAPRSGGCARRRC